MKSHSNMKNIRGFVIIVSLLALCATSFFGAWLWAIVSGAIAFTNIIKFITEKVEAEAKLQEEIKAEKLRQERENQYD
jgi:hypothetical protein